MLVPLVETNGQALTGWRNVPSLTCRANGPPSLHRNGGRYAADSGRSTAPSTDLQYPRFAKRNEENRGRAPTERAAPHADPAGR